MTAGGASVSDQFGSVEVIYPPGQSQVGVSEGVWDLECVVFSMRGVKGELVNPISAAAYFSISLAEDQESSGAHKGSEEGIDVPDSAVIRAMGCCPARAERGCWIYAGAFHSERAANPLLDERFVVCAGFQFDGIPEQSHTEVGILGFGSRFARQG